MSSSSESPPLGHVFVVGYPGDVGGANTECWHTVRLWRQFGLGVTLIPTWRPAEKWKARLDRIGCNTVRTRPDDLENVPGLPGSVVVSFCNSKFLRHAGRFRDLDCRVVWLGCMTWLFADEKRHYRRRGTFDRYVFQSDYQRREVQPQLAKFGVKPRQCHLIRGAFFCDEFPFRPLRHASEEAFVIGRLSRAASDKYSRDTWSIYSRIPHLIRARVMGWNKQVQGKLGRPPAWAECLPPGAETPQQFLSTLHCMMPLNGGAEENWPRCGLEAMAGGVPLVVQNRWGWREMIRHGETGFLADNDDQLVQIADRLAHDENTRLQIAREARRTLEDELADPNAIWVTWQELFKGLSR